MSQIQWTEKTWNPIVGCRRVSAGCENCYAEREVHRRASIVPQHAGLTVVGKNGVRWNGEYNLAEHRLDEPLRRTKPTTYFVNSLSDLFFEPLPFELIAAIFGVMAACPQHTFQVLTKRPARALEFFEWLDERDTRAATHPLTHCVGAALGRGLGRRMDALWFESEWPLLNIHLGVSVEDQATADERIPLLLQCPAAVRWVSYEPALGPVDFAPWLCRHGEIYSGVCRCGWVEPDARHREPRPERINWIVVGGESGHQARPFDLAWARSTVTQCKAAGVPVFVKQLGAKPVAAPPHRPHVRLAPEPVRLKARKGDDMDEWPEDLRVREMPA